MNLHPNPGANSAELFLREPLLWVSVLAKGYHTVRRLAMKGNELYLMLGALAEGIQLASNYGRGRSYPGIKEPPGKPGPRLVAVDGCRVD